MGGIQTEGLHRGCWIGDGCGVGRQFWRKGTVAVRSLKTGVFRPGLELLWSVDAAKLHESHSDWSYFVNVSLAIHV